MNENTVILIRRYDMDGIENAIVCKPNNKEIDFFSKSITLLVVTPDLQNFDRLEIDLSPEKLQKINEIWENGCKKIRNNILKKMKNLKKSNTVRVEETVEEVTE